MEGLLGQAPHVRSDPGLFGRFFVPFALASGLLLLPFAAGSVRSGSLREWWRGSLAVLFLTWLMVSLFTHWWGGGCLGPRYFTGVAPFLALLTAPLWTSTSRRMRAALVATVIFASANQLLGAYNPKVVATPIRRVPRLELQTLMPSLGDCSQAGWESVIEHPRNNSSNVRELTAVFFTRDGRFRSYPVRHFTWKPVP